MKDIENLISEYAALSNEPIDTVRNTYEVLGEGADVFLKEEINRLKKKDIGELPNPNGQEPMITAMPISEELDMNTAQIEAMNIPQEETNEASLVSDGLVNPTSSASELIQTESSGIGKYNIPSQDFGLQSMNTGITPEQKMAESMNAVHKDYADFLNNTNELIRQRLGNSFLNPTSIEQELGLPADDNLQNLKETLEASKKEERERFLKELSKKNKAKAEQKNEQVQQDESLLQDDNEQSPTMEEAIDPRLPYRYGETLLLHQNADIEQNLKQFKEWEDKGYGHISYSEAPNPKGKINPPAFNFNKYGVDELNKQSPIYQEIMMEKNADEARKRLNEAKANAGKKELFTELQQITNNHYKNTGYLLTTEEMIAANDINDIHKIYAQKYAEKELKKNPNQDYHTLYQEYYNKHALPSKTDEEYIKIAQRVLGDYEKGFELDKYDSENTGLDAPNVTTKGNVFEEDKKELAFIQSLKSNPIILKEIGRFYDEEGKYYIGDDRFSRLLQFGNTKGRAEFRQMALHFAGKKDRIKKELDYEKLTQLQYQIKHEKDPSKKNQLIERFNKVVDSDAKTENSIKQLGKFGDAWESVQTRYLAQKRKSQEIEAGYQNGEVLPSIVAIGGNVFNRVSDALKSTVGGVLRIGNMPFNNDTFSKIISDVTKPTEIGGIQSAGMFDQYSDYTLNDKKIRERAGNFYEVTGDKEIPITLNSEQKRNLDLVKTDTEFSWKGVIGTTTGMVADMFLAEAAGGAVLKGVSSLSKINTLKNAVSVFGESSALTRSLRTFNKVLQNPSNNGVAGWFIQTLDDNIKEGLAHGMNNSQATIYGTTQALFTGLLSKINPDTKFFNTTKTFQEKLAYNLLHGDKKNAINLIKDYGKELTRSYGKELVGEEVQELTELFTEHAVKVVYNGTLKDNKFDELSFDEIEDTILQTAITIGALQVGNRVINGSDSKYAEFEGDIYQFSKTGRAEKIAMLAVMDDGRLFPSLKNNFLISDTSIDRLQREVETAKKYIDKIPDKEKHSFTALSQSAAILQNIQKLRNSLNSVDETFKPEIEEKINTLQSDLKEVLNSDLQRHKEQTENAPVTKIDLNAETGDSLYRTENSDKDTNEIEENKDSVSKPEEQQDLNIPQNDVNINSNDKQNANPITREQEQEQDQEAQQLDNTSQENTERETINQDEELNESDLDDIISSINNIIPESASYENAETSVTPVQPELADNEYERKGKIYTQDKAGNFYTTNKNGRQQRVTSKNFIKELNQLADQRKEDNTIIKKEKEGFIYRKLKNGEESIVNSNGKTIYARTKEGKRNPNFEKRKALIFGEKTENEIRQEYAQREKEAINNFVPTNARDLALLYFAEDGKVSAKSISKEVLGNSESLEARGKGRRKLTDYKWAYLGKDVENSIENVAEKLHREYPHIHEHDIRSAVIDVIHSYSNSREIKEELVDLHSRTNDPYYGLTEEDIQEMEYQSLPEKAKSIINTIQVEKTMSNKEIEELYYNQIQSLSDAEQEQIYREWTEETKSFGETGQYHNNPIKRNTENLGRNPRRQQENKGVQNGTQQSNGREESPRSVQQTISGREGEIPELGINSETTTSSEREAEITPITDIQFQRAKGSTGEFRKIAPREFWKFIEKLQQFSKGIFKDAKVYTDWNDFVNHYQSLNKTKSRDYLDSSTPADAKKSLDSSTKVIKNFENPKFNNEIRYQIADEYRGLNKQEKSNLQYEKAQQVVKALENLGYKNLHISRSITFFGVSTYILGDNDLKLRISDHGVSNLDRVWNEIHYSLNTPISDIVNRVNNKQAKIEEVHQKRIDSENLKQQREKLAEEKWGRIKHLFHGMVFKKIDRTYQDFETFSKGGGGNRSNIVQKTVGNKFGNIAYSYEWTETDAHDGRGKEKPSIEFIEGFEENIATNEKPKFFHNGNGIVYGAKLPDGSIYFNPDKINYNTAVHEFSHVWEQIMPKAWKKGLEYFKQTSAGKKIYNELKNKGEYDTLSNDELWSEAMNTYIGNYGEWKTLNPKIDSPMAKFKEWLLNIFRKLGEVLGVRNMTPDERLGDFVNKVYSDLTSGREMKPEYIMEKGMTDEQLISLLKNMGLVQPAKCA